MTRSKVLAAAVLAAFVAGCGGSDDVVREKTVPVTGTVTYKGAPVADASVGFVPNSPPGPTPVGRGAFGRTDAKGEFTLMTFVADDGAVPGDYKVTVTKIDAPPSTGAEEGTDDYVDPEQGGKPPETKHLLPAKYADPRQTDLVATVQDGKPLTVSLDLVD